MKRHPASWEDMSAFVVHFTRGGGGNADSSTMMSIFSQGLLKPANRFGIGRHLCPSPETQQAVCFSEIPPGQWDRLAARRETKQGLAFSKQFLISRGGGPIWYVWKDTPNWHVLQRMMTNASGDGNAPIWQLTPFIDSPGEYPAGPYYFDWEREWRHAGPLSFEPEDVAFLLLPEELHEAARGFFEDARSEHIGPAYLCPYVDPTWDRERIMRTVRGRD